MNTTTLPGQLIRCEGMTRQKRNNLAANPGTRYKIVPLQIAMPADLDDAMITDAINWVLTSLQLIEGPIAHDWQFIARAGADTFVAGSAVFGAGKDSDPNRYDSIIGALRGELARVAA